MNSYLPDEAALAAAHDASLAAAELIRFAREGEYSHRSIFADEVVTKLAGALALSIMLEEKPFVREHDEHGGSIAEMKRAIRKYLDALHAEVGPK